MKEGWEIKKLTDVCSIQYGCAFDSSLFSDSSEDGMPLIRIRDIKDGYSNTHYKGSYADEYVIHRGDYLIGMDGEFNIEPWKSEDALLNQRVCKIESKLKDVSIRFIYRFLKKELKRIEDETPFVTVKHLSAKRLNQVVLDIPPLPEQEKIVAELDCLSGIIEKKRQQLKELDALAQSIFYEMFGDPVTNEKGWEVKKLGDVVKVVGGYAFKSNLFAEEGIPVLRIGNINTGQLRTNPIVYYQEDSMLAKYLVYPRDLVMSLTGTVGKDDYGNVCILDDTYPKYYLNQRNAKFLLSDSIQVYYLKYFLANKEIKAKLTDVNRGVRQGNISNKDIESLLTPLPPLPLQQTFASKIEAIEKQKELIKQSLVETETLFNARMQEYFG